MSKQSKNKNIRNGKKILILEKCFNGMDNTPLASGDKTAYKQIAGCYTDEGDDTSGDSSSRSSGGEEIREFVPRPDPATWFNSIQNNTKAINDSSTHAKCSSKLNTANNNTAESTIRKRPATPFNINHIPETLANKKKHCKSTTKKVEKQLTITHERCEELASVRISVSVPPGVEVITLSVVKRGLSRYTTHALAEDRVDIIPLAASRDLNKFNGIKPSDGKVYHLMTPLQLSASCSNLYPSDYQHLFATDCNNTETQLNVHHKLGCSRLATFQPAC